MVKKSKTVRDAEKIAKTMVSLIEARAKHYRCSDRFTIGYLESFLATHADKKLLAAMEARINHISEQMKEVA